MTPGQIVVGVVIILGFFAALFGTIVFLGLVLEDLVGRYIARFPSDAGRSEESSHEELPAPIFPIEMARTRRRNGRVA